MSTGGWPISGVSLSPSFNLVQCRASFDCHLKGADVETVFHSANVYLGKEVLLIG